MIVRLRPFERSEVTLYHEWMADKQLVGPFVEVESEPLDELLNDYDTDRWQSDRLHRWLIEDETGTIMGFAHCWQFDKYEPHVEFGRVLLPEYQGKGIGTEVLRVLLQLIFETTTCNRAQTISACDNTAAVRTWEKAGLTIEGRLRGFMTLNGQMTDCYLGSMLRCEWEIGKRTIEAGNPTAQPVF
jgi:RimJ/RimL family protein N-acetyltransferase